MTTLDTTKTTTDWTEVTSNAREVLTRAAADHDRSGTFVSDGMEHLRKVGLLTAPVPAELGGGGASFADACEIVRRLGAACGATAVTLSMHYHLLGTQVWRWKHGLPAEAVLRKVASEELLLVTSGASDWVGSSGTVRRTDGGFVVSARKSPCSGAPAGDIFVTSARWQDAPDGPQVVHFSMPFDTDGLRIEQTWDTLGLRGTGSETVVLDDVMVPDAAVTLQRPADTWHPVWNTVLGLALPLIMSAYVGIADAAAREARRLARSKTSAPHIPSLVGAMQVHHQTALDVVAAMVADADDLQFAATEEIADRALVRKSFVARACEETVRTAIEVAGGAGYHRAFPLERLLRDVLGGAFHPLPPATQARFTGRRALGLDPVV